MQKVNEANDLRGKINRQFREKQKKEFKINLWKILITVVGKKYVPQIPCPGVIRPYFWIWEMCCQLLNLNGNFERKRKHALGLQLQIVSGVVFVSF